jgi:hypothetical protein
MHLVHNERTKLTATWFNTLATALIAAGAFAPAAAAFLGVAVLPIDTRRVSILALTCVVVAAVIHIGARLILGRLRE